MDKKNISKNIPPPIPQAPYARMDARKLAENKADEAKKRLEEKQQAKDLKAPDHSPPGQKKPDQKEHGGPQGLEPTRYGDWEKAGRCIDF